MPTQPKTGCIFAKRALLRDRFWPSPVGRAPKAAPLQRSTKRKWLVQELVNCVLRKTTQPLTPTETTVGAEKAEVNKSSSSSAWAIQISYIVISWTFQLSVLKPITDSPLSFFSIFLCSESTAHMKTKRFRSRGFLHKIHLKFWTRRWRYIQMRFNIPLG